jgi:ParB/RepB/Spo0J family partition protein
MAKASQKITLSASRDIPFNKLVFSQSNVRRLKAGVSIDDKAEDIARRGLLQNLNVRPVLDAAGAETGMFEIPAGDRRYRALERLVKEKRLSKTAPIPCIVRDPAVEVSAQEDSLAENVHRVALHPLDQFRAFKALRDQGAGEEEIAARFFVPPTVVKQRLRLASVSENLLGVYAEDGMTLEQLMVFTVSTARASLGTAGTGIGRPPAWRVPVGGEPSFARADRDGPIWTSGIGSRRRRDLYHGGLHCDMPCSALSWLPHKFVLASRGVLPEHGQGAVARNRRQHHASPRPATATPALDLSREVEVRDLAIYDQRVRGEPLEAAP